MVGGQIANLLALEVRACTSLGGRRRRMSIAREGVDLHYIMVLMMGVPPSP